MHDADDWFGKFTCPLLFGAGDLASIESYLALVSAIVWRMHRLHIFALYIYASLQLAHSVYFIPQTYRNGGHDADTRYFYISLLIHPSLFQWTHPSKKIWFFVHLEANDVITTDQSCAIKYSYGRSRLYAIGILVGFKIRNDSEIEPLREFRFQVSRYLCFYTRLQITGSLCRKAWPVQLSTQIHR